MSTVMKPAAVEFTAIDLYERMLGERAADPVRYELSYSRVMKDTVGHYRRARSRAVKWSKAKAEHERGKW